MSEKRVHEKQRNKGSDFTAISVVIDKPAYRNLVAFLKGREWEIATGEQDFGCLRNVFRCFMQRYPEVRTDE